MTTYRIPASAQRAIIQGVYSGDPVSNLEYLGLPPRILELLENSRYQIITLEDLVCLSRDQLLEVKSLGEKSLECILDCLSRYDQLARSSNLYEAVESDGCKYASL